MARVSADPKLNVPSRDTHNEQRDGRHLKEEVTYRHVLPREGRRLTDNVVDGFNYGLKDASKEIAKSIEEKQGIAKTKKVVAVGIPQEARMEIKKRANSAKVSRAKASKAKIRIARKAKK